MTVINNYNIIMVLGLSQTNIKQKNKNYWNTLKYMKDIKKAILIAVYIFL